MFQKRIWFLILAMQILDQTPVWAWGQAGFSAHVTPDNVLYLGAPGVNGWNG